MKLDFSKIIRFSYTFILLLAFNICLAQTQPNTLPDYNVLAPLPGINNTTNLKDYLPAAFNLSVAIAAGLAFVMITLGGITYATSDAVYNKNQGREWITGAIYGLLLVIGAYIILYTINPQILSFNIGVTTPVTQGTIPSVQAGVPMTAQQLADDASVRAQLNPVTINKNPCANGETEQCTNVNGLPLIAINGAKNLLSACKATVGNCVVMISGGTEPGAHATHGVGKPIVDIRPDPGLNKYLWNNPGNPPDGEKVTGRYFNGSHATFVFEKDGGNPGGTSTGDHWHVVFDK